MGDPLSGSPLPHTRLGAAWLNEVTCLVSRDSSSHGALLRKDIEVAFSSGGCQNGGGVALRRGRWPVFDRIGSGDASFEAPSDSDRQVLGRRVRNPRVTKRPDTFILVEVFVAGNRLVNNCQKFTVIHSFNFSLSPLFTALKLTGKARQFLVFLPLSMETVLNFSFFAAVDNHIKKACLGPTQAAAKRLPLPGFVSIIGMAANRPIAQRISRHKSPR